MCSVVASRVPAVQVTVCRYPTSVVHPQADLVVHKVLVALHGYVGDRLVRTPAEDGLVLADRARGESSGGDLLEGSFLGFGLLSYVAPPAADGLGIVLDTANMLIETTTDLLVYLVGRRIALAHVILSPTLDQAVLPQAASAAAAAGNLDKVAGVGGCFVEVVGTPTNNRPILHNSTGVELPSRDLCEEALGNMPNMLFVAPALDLFVYSHGASVIKAGRNLNKSSLRRVTLAMLVITPTFQCAPKILSRTSLNSARVKVTRRHGNVVKIVVETRRQGREPIIPQDEQWGGHHEGQDGCDAAHGR